MIISAKMLRYFIMAIFVLQNITEYVHKFRETFKGEFHGNLAISYADSVIRWPGLIIIPYIAAAYEPRQVDRWGGGGGSWWGAGQPGRGG